jgi:hypothetical protein
MVENWSLGRRCGGANAPAPDLKALKTIKGNPPSLQELGVPLEILEAAEEIVEGSDVAGGIERWRLELLVRFLIAADRRWRPNAERDL